MTNIKNIKQCTKMKFLTFKINLMKYNYKMNK